MAVKIVGTRRNNVGMIIITGTVFVLFVVSGVLGIFQYFKMKGNYQKQVDEYSIKVKSYEKQIEQSLRTVYVPIEDLKYNTKLEESMFDTIEILSSLPKDQYMDKEDFGKLLKTDLKAQTPLMKYMLQADKVDDDLRDAEFNTLTLQTNIAKNDFVDVRIRFPNGEDYIVLSKKKVNDIKLNTGTIWININQRELITVSSATVDAYLRKGTKLYVVKYVQPQTQKGAKTTYPFNADVQKVMMADPNILEKASIALTTQARADLEARINIIPKENLNSVGSGVDKENSEFKKNIQDLEKVQNSKTNENTQTDKSQQKQNGQTGNQSSGQVAAPNTKVDNGDDQGSSLDAVLN
ncbi:SAF domain-containing protein [Acetivibrio cellulolyticus]|uniref:SAF domain-containing protein n=1 Tax=Acetivibrio cellulolyticus TaxID=35830 RepID=UPI0001E2F0E8|nr:SAF domain-containing protein [Acetivibrio cellulolyticus]